MAPEVLADVYLGCFLVGLIATFAMMVLGHGHSHGPAHGHGHAGGHGHAHGHGPAQGHAAHAADAEEVAVRGAGARLGLAGLLGVLLPVTNLPAMLALLTAGGAAGWIALRLGYSANLSLVAAAVAGLVGAQLMAQATALLVRAEAGVVSPRDERGTEARVIARIAPGRVGEIVFSRDGKRQALPARGEDEGLVIEPGRDVVLMRIERGVAYVRPVGDLYEKGGA